MVVELPCCPGHPPPARLLLGRTELGSVGGSYSGRLGWYRGEGNKRQECTSEEVKQHVAFLEQDDSCEAGRGGVGLLKLGWLLCGRTNHRSVWRLACAVLVLWQLDHQHAVSCQRVAPRSACGRFPGAHGL